MIAILVAATYSPQDDLRQARIQTFVQAEQSFSKDAGEVGFRASFLKHFAPNGIGFDPEPHVVSDKLAVLAPEKVPLGYKMRWEPKIADCSLAGDIGFTTGPFVMTTLPDKPAIHMAYFSIWKKMSGGALKVVFDMGTPMAAPPAYPVKFGPTRNASVSPDTAGEAEKKIKELENSLGDPNRSAGLDGRLWEAQRVVAYRPDSQPLFGRADVLAWQSRKEFQATKWEVRDVDVAEKADFAWSWGRMAAQEGGHGFVGWWAHVWCWTPQDGWIIIADVMSKIPSKA